MKRIPLQAWQRQCLCHRHSATVRHSPRSLIKPQNHNRHPTVPSRHYSQTKHLQSLTINASPPEPRRWWEPSPGGESMGEEISLAPDEVETPPEELPSPDPSLAHKSAKLSALHARLLLPERLPLPTLARTLVSATADQDIRFNNSSLAVLGADILSYHTSEYLLCNYPRLPMEILFAAMHAYVGPPTLASLAREWGVEAAAAPGGEVDPGLLQYRSEAYGKQAEEEHEMRQMELKHGGYDIRRGWLDPAKPGEPAGGEQREGWKKKPQGNRDGGKVGTGRPNEQHRYRRSITSRIVYDDEFGNLRGTDATEAAVEASRAATAEAANDAHLLFTLPTTTFEHASSSFVRALTGAVYLHAGRTAAKLFHQHHLLARKLDLAQLMGFKNPTADLTRLCRREGFEPPIARLMSETGRLSSHPVFVVGVFSGRDLLGEGVGGSLVEAKNRAAAAAMRGWYLYRPVEVTVPSETEWRGMGRAEMKWIPNVPDVGEVVT